MFNAVFSSSHVLHEMPNTKLNRTKKNSSYYFYLYRCQQIFDVWNLYILMYVDTIYKSYIIISL